MRSVKDRSPAEAKLTSFMRDIEVEVVRCKVVSISMIERESSREKAGRAERMEATDCEEDDRFRFDACRTISDCLFEEEFFSNCARMLANLELGRMVVGGSKMLKNKACLVFEEISIL